MQEMSAPLSTRAWVSIMVGEGTISWIGICMNGVLDFMVTAHVEEVRESCIKQGLPSKNPRV